MSEDCLTFTEMHQISTALQNLDICSGRSIEKFNKLVEFYKEHAEEPDCVATLHKIVGVTNSTLYVFYELSCGKPQKEVRSWDNGQSYYSKHATIAESCSNVISSTELAHTMIKHSEFNKIMQKFTDPLRDTYRTDADEDCTYEFHEVEIITPNEQNDNTGFVLRFTDRFAIAALEEGRKLKSINMLYDMFDELQEKECEEDK